MKRGRSRCSPTFHTPSNPSKRVYRPLRLVAARPARRRLLLDNRSSTSANSHSCESPIPHHRERGQYRRVAFDCWTNAEVKALLEFILFHSYNNQWPSHHQKHFWESAAEFIKARACSRHLRSGNSCRYKVVKWLKKRYENPQAAEKVLLSRRSIGTQVVCHQLSSSTQTYLQQVCTTGCQCPTVLTLSVFTQTSSVSNPDCPLSNPTGRAIDISALSHEFSDHCKTAFELDVPVDFLTYSASAMVRLKRNKRSNVVYNLSKCIGKEREDYIESRFPVSRMPMGLFEYVTNFYVAEHVNTVPSCPEDYLSWLQTMYCHFGQRWAKLHHGPMWSVANSDTLTNPHERLTMAALTNVPSVSERTIRRKIAAGQITVGSHIQTAVLDEAARLHPSVYWWIKADGADLVAGLGTSVSGIWSGDQDLDDGLLEKAYESHQQHVNFISTLGQNKHLVPSEVVEQISIAQEHVVGDVDFICTCLKGAATKYSAKQAEGNSPEKLMFSLAWDVEELQRLDKSGRQLRVDCQALKDSLLSQHLDISRDNIRKQLSSLRENLLKYAKSVIKYRRTAASHILILMISSELRDKKPYALPVQCIPYVSLSDESVRAICDKLISEMKNRGMKIAGFTTNGEWNSLRSKGQGRPLSIFEVRSQVRKKYQRLGMKTLKGMLTPIDQPHGSVKAAVHNASVSSVLLLDISNYLKEGTSLDDIITCLRSRTVPPGYKSSTWVSGREETLIEKCRSILAQLEFSALIKQYSSNGVPFDSHLHVPEVHKCTGNVFLQREHEGHLFKRIANSLRRGKMPNIGLERFVEALHCKDTGLTYPALTGVRKQSVQDVERLFGPAVIEFMKRRKYMDEYELLKVVRNWRRAIDERGLTEHQRQLFLQEFKEYICRDLMPWYGQGANDFSTIEVNRPIDNVRGFTTETLIGVVASIETRQWRYAFATSNNLPLENPRSSTTDDVECFFSILRDCVGKDFTLKQVYFEWRKVVTEFLKRIDPQLQFHYYTGNDRYYEEDMPSFNEPRSKPKCDRIPRQELIAAEISRRASLPVRGSLSIRATFHAKPVYIPPLASATSIQKIITEHSYA